MAQATKIFSKLLTKTDIKKRLAIPAKTLPALPDFNRSHAVKFQLMYGTRMWPIVCSVRKQGYKKPVFSGGWRNFVIGNGFKDKVGYELTLYKVQDDESGTFYYTVEVEKPDGPSVASSPRSVSLQNHELVGESDETPGAISIQARRFEHEKPMKEQLAGVDVPHIKEEKGTVEAAEFAADHGEVPFVDYVVENPPMSTFGTNVSTDDIAHVKIQLTEKKLFMGMGNDETQLLHAFYMTKEESDINNFDLTDQVGSQLAYGTTQADGDTYYKSAAGLNLGQLGRAETVNLNLDLTLALPELAHSKPW